MIRTYSRSADLAEKLVPGAAYVEAYSDTPETAMHPSEADLVRHASPERRREFGTVRHCARTALQQIGTPAGPILPDADRAPRWPAGVVGSMTHCDGYRAAVVARADRFAALGIDAEPHSPLPPETHALVLRDDELLGLAALTGADPHVHWDRLTFCAKEAVYKAWFPNARQWLDFADVAVTLRLDGTYRADIHHDQADRGPMNGRWLVGRGLAVAACSVVD